MNLICWLTKVHLPSRHKRSPTSALPSEVATSKTLVESIPSPRFLVQQPMAGMKNKAHIKVKTKGSFCDDIVTKHALYNEKTLCITV